MSRTPRPRFLALGSLVGVILGSPGCGSSSNVEPPPANDIADAGGAPAPPAEVPCEAPPPSTCTDERTALSFDGPGVRVDGTCRYASSTTRCAADEICVDTACLGADATLSSLEVSGGRLSFSPARTGYVVTAPRDATSVAVTATLGAGDATLTIDGVPAVSGQAHVVAFPLASSRARVQVAVTGRSGASATYSVLVQRYGQQAFVKAAHPDAGDRFGRNVRLSADGGTLVVRALWEDGASRVVNGDQTNNAAENAGAAYVFVRDAEGRWSQQAYLKSSNLDAVDYFGISLAISANGDTIAVGATGEASGNGDPSNNTTPWSGAVFVFQRSASGVWSEAAYLKASQITPSSWFGERVVLSAAGDRLLVAAANADVGAGRLYVFGRNASGAWVEETSLVAANRDSVDNLGYTALAMSANGDTVVAGAFNEDGSATGVDGEDDNGAVNSGAVYVFARAAGGAWSQQAYIKASNTAAGALFGFAAALSADGDMLAVGAPDESGASRGVAAPQVPGVPSSGAVYLFRRSATGWSQESYIKSSNAGSNARFGYSVALSAAGDLLVAGAPGEGGAGTGVEANQALQTAAGSGAAYVFRRSAHVGTWAQEAYLKASNTRAGASFGVDVALSVDGVTLAVGASSQAGGQGGVDASQDDTSASEAGAVYVFAL